MYTQQKLILPQSSKAEGGDRQLQINAWKDLLKIKSQQRVCVPSDRLSMQKMVGHMSNA